jgi:hypothetical protein
VRRRGGKCQKRLSRRSGIKSYKGRGIVRDFSEPMVRSQETSRPAAGSGLLYVLMCFRMFHSAVEHIIKCYASLRPRKQKKMQEMQKNG